MNRLTVPDALARVARAHLFSDGGEHFVFFLCTVETSSDSVAFVAKDVLLIGDGDLEPAGYSLSIRLDVLLDVMNRAAREGAALVEGHSHPRGFGRFSYTDLEGFKEFVPYVIDVLKKPYGATIWDGRTVVGACWRRPEWQEAMAVEAGPEKSPKAKRLGH
jgi:hypothetical protein